MDSNKVLWRKNKNDLEHEVLVVPASLQSNILSLGHEIPSAGHQSVDRTLSRLKPRYYWMGMNRDVESFVRACSACNKNKKPNRHARSTLTLFHAGFPMERVHIDF